jgi:hypothetical protein
MGTSTGRSTLRPLAVVALVTSVIASLLLLFATPALAQSQPIFQFKEKSTGVVAQTVTTSGDIQTYILVVVRGSNRGWQVDYYSEITDLGTGSTINIVTGSTIPTEFTLKQPLSSAHLQATIPLQDYDSNPAGTASIDLTWTASGPLTTSTVIDKSTSHGGGFYMLRVRGSSRAASVAGTFTTTDSYFFKDAGLFITRDPA